MRRHPRGPGRAAIAAIPYCHLDWPALAPLTGKGNALRHAKPRNIQRLGVFRSAFVAHLLDPFEVSQLNEDADSSNCCQAVDFPLRSHARFPVEISTGMASMSETSSSRSSGCSKRCPLDSTGSSRPALATFHQRETHPKIGPPPWLSQHIEKFFASRMSDTYSFRVVSK